MKAYSIEFREKIVKIYEQGDTSVRKVAQRFDVSKAFIQKILKTTIVNSDITAISIVGLPGIGKTYFMLMFQSRLLILM